MPNRSLWICGIFAAELVLIVLAFQVLAPLECRLTTIEAACRGLRGAVLRALCLGALLGVYLWAVPPARADFARITGARTGGRGWAMLHLLAVVGLFLPLAVVAPDRLNAAFGALFPWLGAGAALAMAGGLFWLAAPRDWLGWLRPRAGLLAVITGVAMVLPDIAAAIGPLWYWDVLTEATFVAVALLLSLLAERVVIAPAAQVIGMDGFAVAVADSCSGVEGFALITAFMGIYAWLFRDGLRMGRYWAVVWPLALLASWLLNVLRIAALIHIGAFVSPALAANGFHSFAGWLFFILLAFAVLVAANRVAWLSRPVQAVAGAGAATGPGGATGGAPGAAMAAGPPPMAQDDTAARILPFIVFMLSGVVAQTFWAAPELAFPLQAVAMTAALWLVRRPLAQYLAAPDAVAVGAGLAVGLGWILLAPAAPPPAAALAALPTGLFAFWAAMRILGTALLVPVIEELFFRGYVQARLDDGTRARRALAIAISAGLFAALHGRFVEAALAGVVFSLLYLRRGRLADAIAAHATANALIAAMAAWRGDWALI